MTTRSAYARIAQTYASRAPSLLLLAFVIFGPLGLVHAATLHLDGGSPGVGGVGVVAVAGVLAVLSAIGLVGEVFYAGAVSISLTHGEERAPSLTEIAARIPYRRLIAVDLIYATLVATGIVLFVLPGILAFVYLGLAAPIVEIEKKGVRDSLRHSFRLVRGRFWLVLAVLVPIELAGDGLTDMATEGVNGLLGGSLLADWLADSLSNIALTPFYAVAAVILTIELAAEKGRAARPTLGTTSR